MVGGVDPAPNRFFIVGQPLGNLGARFAIEQQHNRMIAFTQPPIVGPAKGSPNPVTRHARIRDLQHAQALPGHHWYQLYPRGPENRDSFLGSL
jgi:hypothetical protein